MKYEEFLGQVQARARLADMEEAVRATRATLQTLAERVSEGGADSLAAQLPTEIGYYLKINAPALEKFGFQEFIKRVTEKEGGKVDEPDAAHHARAVLSVVTDATSGEMPKICEQLPNEFNPLFESGSEGKMPAP